MLIFHRSSPPQQHGKTMSAAERELAGQLLTAMREAAESVPVDVGQAHIHPETVATAYGQALASTEGWAQYEAAIQTAAENAARSTMPTPTRKGVSTLPSISGGFDIINPAVTEWSKKHSATMITNITTSARDAVNELVQTSVGGGLTIGELQRKLRAAVPLTQAQGSQLVHVMNGTYKKLVAGGMDPNIASKNALDALNNVSAAKIKQRANMIARTELSNAENAGHMMGLYTGVKAGTVAPGTMKEWNTAEDERTCPICRPLNGEIVQWNKPFSNGFQCAPLHANCRCSFSELPPDYASDPMYKPLATEEELYGGTVTPKLPWLGWEGVDLSEIEGAVDKIVLSGDYFSSGSWEDALAGGPMPKGSVATTPAENPNGYTPKEPEDEGPSWYQQKWKPDPAAWAAQNMPKAETILTAAQRDVVTDYTGSLAGVINRGLRDGDLSAEVDRIERKLLDAAISRSPAPEEIHVVRNVPMQAFEDEMMGGVQDADLRKLIGKIVTDKGYLSTTIGDRAVFTGGEVFLQITVPKGSPGLWVKTLSHHANENEVLLPRETKLAVTGAKREGTKWTVSATVIPK